MVMRRLLRTALVAGWLSSTAAWAAAPLMIWPVDPVIVGEQRAVALWVENRGTEPLSLQARVFAWSQSNGQDQFAAQKAVVASPPISLIPPGERQMIRLIATEPVPPQTELAYRVLIDELPPPPPPASDAPMAQPRLGVQLQVRYAIPLFVYAPGTMGQRMAPQQEREMPWRAEQLLPELSWKVDEDDDGYSLLIRNTGRSHARITQVSWAGGLGSSDVPVNAGLLGYVLPNSERRWDLKDRPPAGRTLKASVNGRAAPLRRAP